MHGPSVCRDVEDLFRVNQCPGRYLVVSISVQYALAPIRHLVHATRICTNKSFGSC